MILIIGHNKVKQIRGEEKRSRDFVVVRRYPAYFDSLKSPLGFHYLKVTVKCSITFTCYQTLVTVI